MFLTYIVPLSIFLPIIAALFRFSKLDSAAKIIFSYLICSGLINLAAIILVAYRQKNLPLLHLYTTVEAVLILSYFRNISNSSLVKSALKWIIIGFPILCLLNALFLQSIYEFNTNTRPLEGLLIIFFCLLYFYQTGFTENWLTKRTSWFNMGILLYFPASLVIFMVSNKLVFGRMNVELNTVLWNIHATLVMLMYFLWTKAFLSKTDGR